MIEISDDRKFNHLPHRSFAVYKKSDDSILPTIAKTLLQKRDDYKALAKKNKDEGNKILEKKFE